MGSTGRLACAGALCVSLLGAAAGDARAADLFVKLHYDAGPGCPDAAELKAVVSARLGYDPFKDAAPYLVLVRIAPGADSIAGHVEWRDSQGNWAGEQAFPRGGADCLRLARTIAFALVVQIQLLAKSSAAETGGDPAPEPKPPNTPVETPGTAPPAAAVALPVPTPPDAAPPPAAGRVFVLGAGPSLGFGMSSSPVLAGRLFGAVTWPRASLELAAEASMPATTRRADGAGFSQQRLIVSAAACATRARWNACALANAGAIRMAGEDIDRPTSATVPVAEAGARIALTQSLGGRAFLRAHADGLVRLIRWTGRLDEVPVWTAPRFAATLGLAAGFRFP